MEKKLTEQERAEAFREILNPNTYKVFLESCTRFELMQIQEYAEKALAIAENDIYRLASGKLSPELERQLEDLTPQELFKFWAQNHSGYEKATTVIKIITEAIGKFGRENGTTQKRTKYENEFFSITEHFNFEFDDIGTCAFDSFDYSLFNNEEKFKAEIIENITELTTIDRVYYLNRISDRLNRIPEGLLVSDETGKKEPIGIRLSINDKSGIKPLEVSPNEVQSYFNMVKRYKTQMINFIENLVKNQQELSRLTNAEIPAKPEPSELNEKKINLSEILNGENLFIKGMEMGIVYEHFKPLTIKKNKAGQPYLTPEQLVAFLKRGFIGDKSVPKQKINYMPGERGFIVKRFYEFYGLAFTAYYVPNRKQPFINLFLDCFEGWEESTVRAFFKPGKVMESWD